MQEHAGIQRDGATLEAGIRKIDELKGRLDAMHVEGSRMYNPGWHTCRDVRYMIAIGEAILRSSVARTESRGAHWRKDHLDKDPEQMKVNYTTRRDGPTIVVGTQPVAPMPGNLAGLFTAEDYA
jgi:succinate dehydrogenase / fumarate reductase flavoprotein subunit